MQFVILRAWLWGPLWEGGFNCSSSVGLPP
jgi:hypothetical protein